jgi:hypothetical protein
VYPATNTFAQHIKNDMCPIATFRFRLPEEQGDFDAARLGQAALSALWEIDQHCRSLLKHGDSGDETRRLAEEIRAIIPAELLEA